MLAYRHAFHAGNHADVLKHLVLTSVLRHMAAKDKPYTLIDTHAGAGGYSIEGRYAQQHAEHAGGIGLLYDAPDLPAPLAQYVQLVRDFNGGKKLTQYPGSPALARALLRESDRLRAYELHPTDERILASYLSDRPHTQVRMADGFAALKGELPPPSKRGVVLIDPPYEIKADYGRVLAALRESLQRMADGVVMIWFPQLQLLESVQLLTRLKAAAEQGARKGWLHARLTVRKPEAGGFGMLGSSVFVANPPFLLAGELAPCLPLLAERLGVEGAGQHALERFER